MAQKLFTEWLQDKINNEASTFWQNPTLRDPASNFRGNPRMDDIQRFVQNTIAHGGDPMQTMPNIAANANMYNQPNEFQGSEQPLSWKMLGQLRQWGFGDQEQFGKWWTNGGRDAVSKMTQEIHSRTPRR